MEGENYCTVTFFLPWKAKSVVLSHFWGLGRRTKCSIVAFWGRWKAQSVVLSHFFGALEGPKCSKVAFLGVRRRTTCKFRWIFTGFSANFDVAAGFSATFEVADS